MRIFLYKSVLILMILLWMASPSTASLTKYFEQGNGMTDTGLTQFLGPFMQMFAANMNSGLFFTTHNDGLISAGVQANMTVNLKEGILKLSDNDTSILATPSLFVNFKIPFIDLVPFVSGLGTQTEGQVFGYFGAGAAYTFVNVSIFQLKAAFAYHWVSGYEFFSLGTATLNVMPQLKIPIPGFPLFVFANAGANLTHLNTTLLNADGKEFTKILLGYSVSAGFLLEMFDFVGVGYEITFYPTQNHHISAGVYF